MLEQVIPNAFVLTNQKDPRTDRLPDLVYYVNADSLPFHSEWYRELRRLLCENRVAGMRVPLSFPGIKWRPTLPDGYRDQLHMDGYNYAGLFVGFGVCIWSDTVTLYNGQTMRLYDALVVMLVLKRLNEISKHFHEEGASYRELEFITSTFYGWLCDLTAARVLGDAPFFKARAEVSDFTQVRFAFVSSHSLYRGEFTVHPRVNGRLPITLEGPLMSHALEIQKLLYLPGTIQFDYLDLKIAKP